MRKLLYYLSLPARQLWQGVHNSYGILNVWDLILLRPMPAGLVPSDHPFCTGIDPETKQPIWPSNVLFRTDRSAQFDEQGVPSDDEIVSSVGQFMASMVAQSASSEARPLGARTRMPPAVYYIHGSVHYNGGWLLFNDFAEAIEHLTDRRFRKELYRFVRREKREPLICFRTYDYDAREYADFLGFVRTIFPYFANSNGAHNAPVWGNVSVYPTVNIVTGNWIRDVRALATEEGQRSVLRRPVAPEDYFATGPYKGWRSYTLPPERWVARMHEARIRRRKERGNVYFVDKKKLDEGFRYDPEHIPSIKDVVREKVLRTR